MKKKLILIVSILFAILFISSISFANNDVKNGIHNVTDSIVDGTERLGDDVRSGISNAEDTVENGVKDIGTAVSEGAKDVTQTADNGYSAVRTTASDITTNNTMNASLWIWLTLSIAAVIIVALVWYYGTQKTDRY